MRDEASAAYLHRGHFKVAATDFATVWHAAAEGARTGGGDAVFARRSAWNATEALGATAYDGPGGWGRAVWGQARDRLAGEGRPTRALWGGRSDVPVHVVQRPNLLRTETTISSYDPSQVNSPQRRVHFRSSGQATSY